jgi:hypothetical protein
MLITVINATRGRLTDERLQAALRAVNRQIANDFEPYWGFGATLRLVGTPRAKLRQVDLRDMRGDAILYVYDEVRASDADGFHMSWFRGVPYGVVYVTLADLMHEDWTVTLSHEALELIADPETNLLVQAPSPRHRRNVYYWYEVCDPVQNESYLVDGERVSNFVLPAYFTAGEEVNGRNDFLGTRVGARTVRSFGVNPGGYLGYYDPHTRKTAYVIRPDDPVAAARKALKGRLRTGRGTRRRTPATSARR